MLYENNTIETKNDHFNFMSIDDSIVHNSYIPIDTMLLRIAQQIMLLQWKVASSQS